MPVLSLDVFVVVIVFCWLHSKQFPYAANAKIKSKIKKQQQQSCAVSWEQQRQNLQSSTNNKNNVDKTTAATLLAHKSQFKTIKWNETTQSIKKITNNNRNNDGNRKRRKTVNKRNIYNYIYTVKWWHIHMHTDCRCRNILTHTISLTHTNAELPACLPTVCSPHSERWSCRNVSPSSRRWCLSVGQSGGRFVVFMRSGSIVYNVTQRLGNETFQFLLKRECVWFVRAERHLFEIFLRTANTNAEAAVKRPTVKQI